MNDQVPATDGPYKFEIGDIVRVLPSSGKWADTSVTGRDFSECEISDRSYPPNKYGRVVDTPSDRTFVSEDMPAYRIRSNIDGSPGFAWECDIELVRKKIQPKSKKVRNKYRSIDDE